MTTFEPRVWGRVAGLLRRANRSAGELAIFVEDGKAELRNRRFEPYEERGFDGMQRLIVPVDSLLDEGPDTDPAKVILAGRTRFTVPGAYGDLEIDNCSAWATFEEAVRAARTTIDRFAYPTVKPGPGDIVEDGVKVIYSTACVALRTEWRDAPHGVALGSDTEILRWHVTRERVILAPVGHNVSDEQIAAAEVLGDRERGRHGWA